MTAILRSDSGGQCTRAAAVAGGLGGGALAHTPWTPAQAPGAAAEQGRGPTLWGRFPCTAVVLTGNQPGPRRSRPCVAPPCGGRWVGVWGQKSPCSPLCGRNGCFSPDACLWVASRIRRRVAQAVSGFDVGQRRVWGAVGCPLPFKWPSRPIHSPSWAPSFFAKI